MQFLLSLCIYVLVGSICRAALCPSRATLSIDKHFIYLVKRDEQMEQMEQIEQILLLLILGSEGTKNALQHIYEPAFAVMFFLLKQ